MASVTSVRHHQKPVATFGHSALPSVSVMQGVGKATRHYANIMVQHQDWMKYMAMIVASAILVASRIGIAWHSVVASQDPATQSYAKKEAIRTTAREAGGLTFSYLLFKFIENRLKRFTEGLGQFTNNDKKYKGMDGVNRNDILPGKWAATKQYFTNLRKAFARQNISSDLDAEKLYRHLTEINFDNANVFSADGKAFGSRYHSSKMFRWLVNGSVRLGKVLDLHQEGGRELIASLNNSQKTMGSMRSLYKAFSKSFPLITAGTVALGLSGFFLEWFTLNHMDEVSDKLSQMRPRELTPAANQLAMDTVHRAERVFQRFGARL